MKKTRIAILFLITMFSATNTMAKSCDIPAPPSCFEYAPGKEQTYNEDTTTCKNRGFSIKLNTDQATYTNIKTNETFSSENFESVKKLQRHLQTHPYTKQVITNNEYCQQSSFADGKYGNCTYQVYTEFLRRACDDNGNIIKKIEVTVLDDIDNKKVDYPEAQIKEKKIQGKVETLILDNVFEEDEVIISAPGYEPKTVLGKNLKAEIKLKPDSTLADEVIIINKKITVIDAKTNEKLENPKAKTETKEFASNNGIIDLKSILQNETVSISHAGYNSKNIKASDLKNTIALTSFSRDKSGNSINWDENTLRPKFQTGANWNNRKYKGDASDINYWLQKFSGKITGILSAIAVLIIAYNGFLLTVAGSDDETMKKAKSAITWALVGLVGINFVYIIVKTVISLTF